MTMQSLDCVYVGTIINANYLKSILLENEIQSIVRDQLLESSRAGFAAASVSNAAQVFVDEKDFAQAEEIVFKLFKESE